MSLDTLLNGIAWLLVEVLLVGTGRLVTRVASLGHWRGEAFGRQEGRVQSLAGSLSFKLDGQRVLTRTALLFVGIGFYAVVAVLLFAATAA